MNKVLNPFNITKAVDFSDQEILDLWVDWPSDSGSGLTELIKPTSPMPMFVIGGKGSGKTHLIRYFSFSLQAMRYGDDFFEGILKEGFVGIYFRCGGLNPSRFTGKNVSPEQWNAIFSYYIDLWFAFNVLSVIKSLCKDRLKEKEQLFCRKFSSLFDAPEQPILQTYSECISYVECLQHGLDFEVNNCVFTSKIDTTIVVTRGRLVFGIPKIFSEIFGEFGRVIFLYLVDEYENFNFEQQKYFNTLIREKDGPCTFKVGSRLFGIKTHSTFCDDEENKEGSEFEYLKLDKYYRDSNAAYTQFARKIITARLKASGYHFENDSSSLDSLFATIPQDSLGRNETAFLTKLFSERTHFKKFDDHLKSTSAAQISSEIMTNIRSDEFPVLEKAAINVIYKNWSRQQDFLNISRQLQSDIKESIVENKFCGLLQKVEHFKSDFIAQIYRENDHRLKYSGLSAIVDISWGNPRHLLMILKRIFSWGIFKNEISPGNLQISIESQNKGIIEASDWFFNDSKLIGSNGDHVQKSIEKLCDLFRGIRYSSKPSECSVCAFSVSPSVLTARSLETLKIAKQWSLIVKVGTHVDKNSGSKIDKYQINRLLSPRWDIAISRRGVIELNTSEANSIFDDSHAEPFEAIRGARLSRMEPPFRLKEKSDTIQHKLIEF